MSGVNDTDTVADELATLLRGLLCHINLIPLNPVAEAIGPDGTLLTRPTSGARRGVRGETGGAWHRGECPLFARDGHCGGLRPTARRDRARAHDGGGMTRIAYFDMPAGISGDMTLAAFLHAGLSLEDSPTHSARSDSPATPCAPKRQASTAWAARASSSMSHRVSRNATGARSAR